MHGDRHGPRWISWIDEQVVAADDPIDDETGACQRPRARLPLTAGSRAAAILGGHGHAAAGPQQARP
jgi:hypothetical protein